MRTSAKQRGPEREREGRDYIVDLINAVSLVFQAARGRVISRGNARLYTLRPVPRLS